MSEAGGVPMGWHKSPFEGYAVTVRRPAQCRQQLSSTCLPAPVLTDTLFSARSEQHGAPRGQLQASWDAWSSSSGTVIAGRLR